LAINFSTMIYGPCQDQFGRTCIFTSATGDSYSGTNRGIYDSTTLNVALEDGSILSDQNTILDIRAIEFPVLPAQDDTVSIPYDPISQLPDLGSYQIINLWHNGGGEITLQLRKLVP
jgi:hypothetical protein